MLLWLDAILVEKLSQPVADFLSRTIRLNCYILALLAAGLALCSSVATLISFAPVMRIYGNLGFEFQAIAVCTTLGMILSDLVMIGRSWYLKRTVRPMTMSPDRLKLSSLRVACLLCVTAQLIVMNTFSTMGVEPGSPSWFMLAHHLSAAASLYLMACTPTEPPPKTVQARLASSV